MEKNIEIVNGLHSKGINLSETDFAIADVISSFVEKTSVKVRKDYDGYVIDEVAGFVRNQQVEALINAFPAAALYLFNAEGHVAEMVEAYLRQGYVHHIARYLNDEPYKEKMLYASREEFKQEQATYGDGYDDRLASPKFTGLPSDAVRDKLTEFSAKELKSIANYNKFVEEYGKGARIR